MVWKRVHVFDWPQREIGVAFVDPHGFGGEVGTSDLDDDVRYFGKLPQPAFDSFADLDRFRQRNARHLAGFHQDRPFIELRHEFRADEVKGTERDAQHQNREGNRDQAVIHCPRERACISAIESLHQRMLAMLPAGELPEGEGSQQRHHRQREDERAQQRRAHGDRHRPEHAPFQAFQEKNGHVDGDNDGHRERHRAGRLHVPRGEPIRAPIPLSWPDSR